jgi:hypothetical protein
VKNPEENEWKKKAKEGTSVGNELRQVKERNRILKSDGFNSERRFCGLEEFERVTQSWANNGILEMRVVEEMRIAEARVWIPNDVRVRGLARRSEALENGSLTREM